MHSLHYTRGFLPFFLLFLLLSLLSCERGEEGSAGWTPPDYESMPYAFSAAEREGLPAYAQQWHAPQGFRGFVHQWNRENSREGESSSEPFIAFHHPEELPADLIWETGMNEPELGSPKAKRGGHFRLAILRSYPPNVREFGIGSNHAVRSYLYDLIDIPLVRLHPGTGKVIPGTAEAWAVSAEGDTVYYRLDAKARYSDGEPVRAQDVLTALYLRCSSFSAEPFARDFYLNKVRQLSFYGDRVFSVRLKQARPLAVYEAMLPMSCTRFYAEFGPDYQTRYQWRRPPTTGGYDLDKSGDIAGRQMRLKAVKDWWARERRYTRYSANVETMTYGFVNELIKARELFRMGQLDSFSSRASEDWYENLEIPEVHHGFIQRVYFNNIWPRNAFGIHLNSSHPQLMDKNVRLGIQHALHVQAAIDTVLRGDFARQGSYFAGYGEYTHPELKPRDFDPTRAREYFAKAGYTEAGADGILQKPDGTRLQLIISSRTDSLYDKILSVMKKEAARCGLDLRSEQMDDTLYFTRIREKSVQAGIFSWAFAPPIPDPEPYLHSDEAYDERGAARLHTNNIMAIAIPELDEAIERASHAATLEDSIAAHHRIQELVHDHASWVPAWSTTYWRFAQWAWVKWPGEEASYNFCPPRYQNPLNSLLFWIDEEEKARLLRDRVKGFVGEEREFIIPLPTAL